MQNVKDNGEGLNVTHYTVHGYARCSTSEDRQDVGRQVRELKAAGAQRVWMEYVHGDSAQKAELQAMLEAAGPGDTVLALEVCPSTWPPQARSIRTMPPPFAAGRRRIGAGAKVYQTTHTRRARAYE